jgi:hypothetical protein
MVTKDKRKAKPMKIEIIKGSENPVAQFFSAPSSTPETDALRSEIEGWKNKWECAVEMAARAENERDEYRALLIRIYNDINVLHTGDAIRELTRQFRDENFN